MVEVTDVVIVRVKNSQSSDIKEAENVVMLFFDILEYHDAKIQFYIILPKTEI